MAKSRSAVGGLVPRPPIASGYTANTTPDSRLFCRHAVTYVVVNQSHRSIPKIKPCMLWNKYETAVLLILLFILKNLDR